MRSCFFKVKFVAVLSVFILLGTTIAGGDEKADLVAPGAKVEKLAGGFVFTEGPASDAAGNIYFSDIPNNRIHKWSLDGKLTTFRENSGRANGLYFDKQGNLLACEGGNRRLTTIGPDGKMKKVLADRYQGKKLNSPNDLWIDPQGGVFFTDPRYGSQEGLEQGGFFVYYLSPQGELIRVIDDLVKPNGVVGTADGKLLYVADPGDKKTYVYRIEKGGVLGTRKLAAAEGSDGMTLDRRGNLYLTRGAVLVFSPQGKQIATIETPEGPANVTFGGKDNRTLFITARKGLYSIRMNVRGQ